MNLTWNVNWLKAKILCISFLLIRWQMTSLKITFFFFWKRTMLDEAWDVSKSICVVGLRKISAEKRKLLFKLHKKISIYNELKLLQNILYKCIYTNIEGIIIFFRLWLSDFFNYLAYFLLTLYNFFKSL